MRRTVHSRSRVTLAMVGLLLVTTWLYAPALDFGLIWDDPLWYGRVVGKSLGMLIKPMPDYHFYRPLLVLYNRLFLHPDNIFALPLLHSAQIGWHLLHIVLVYALICRLRLGRWTAAVVGGVMALHPFSYQAVAWAAPAQPLAATLQTGAWLAFVVAHQRQGRHHLAAGLSLLLFIMALVVLEGTAALAGLPLLLVWVLRQQGAARPRWKLSLAFPIIAAAFGVLWLQIPRQSGFTALTFERPVALYLLQGFIFPWLGRPSGYAPNQLPAPAVLIALSGVTLVGLLVAARHTGRIRPALFGLTWALLGIAPSIAGLEYSYVSLSSRLLYSSSPGLALMWACILLPPAGGAPVRRWWRIGGAVLFGLVALQSGLLLVGFQRMYTIGTNHLGELIQAASTDQADLLFVNFPDRYAPKRPPFPMGNWGLTLAPVSVDLGAFPALTTAHRPRTISCNMPWIDAKARDTGPYHIDTRGTITPPDQLYKLAHRVDAVYLSRHSSDGTFALQWAGTVAASQVINPVSTCRLAVFGQTLCLQAAQVDLETGQLGLTLTWLSLSTAQPHDTIFAHLGSGLADQTLVAQADGDAWLGMLPLVALQPGDTIQERRVISLPETLPQGRHIIRVGVYNRLTGERLPATTPQGDPLPANTIIIGYLP